MGYLVDSDLNYSFLSKYTVCVPHVKEPSVVENKENKYFWLNILRKAIEAYS